MRATFLLLALPLAACGLEPRACTTEAVAGINVAPRDSVTNVLITDSVSGFVAEGAYRDTLTSGTYLAAAYERPGVYTVHLSRPGFRHWVRGGIEVEEGECHVVPVTVVARMRREEWEATEANGALPNALFTSSRLRPLVGDTTYVREERRGSPAQLFVDTVFWRRAGGTVIVGRRVAGFTPHDTGFFSAADTSILMGAWRDGQRYDFRYSRKP